MQRLAWLDVTSLFTVVARHDDLAFELDLRLNSTRTVFTQRRDGRMTGAAGNKMERPIGFRAKGAIWSCRRMCDDRTQKKQQYLQQLAAVEARAPELEAIGQNLAQAGRFLQDTVPPIRESYAQIPAGQLSADQWDRQIAGLTSLQSSVDHVHGSMPQYTILQALTSSVVNTASSTIIRFASNSLASVLDRTQFEDSRGRLLKTLDRYPLLDDARSAMRRLGLNSRRGNKQSPLDLIDAAQAALEWPVLKDGGPVSILISLRESILAMLGELIARRPSQEPAGKDSEKVVSVGRQCGHAELPSAFFEGLGEQVAVLLNDFSGSKQAEIPRERLVEQFNRGLLFINAFLRGIDERKLRRT